MTARDDDLRADLRALADEWEADSKHDPYDGREAHENDLLAGTIVPALRAVLDAHEPDSAGETDEAPLPSAPCRDCGPGYHIGDEGCRHDPYQPESGETGICRTCAQPIWWEQGEIGGREGLGWSDRIKRGGDSIVCFKAVGYRHVPMGEREEAIYRAGFTAGREEPATEPEAPRTPAGGEADVSCADVVSGPIVESELSQQVADPTVSSETDQEEQGNGDTTGRQRSQGNHEHAQGDGAQRRQAKVPEVRAKISTREPQRRPDARRGLPVAGLQLRADDDAPLGVALDALREAFSGDEFEENAQAAAGEGEWSWFRWLAVTTVEACVTPPGKSAEAEQ